MLEKEIKNKLTPAQYGVMRGRKKEPPYFGKHWDLFDEGVYACAACGTDLFSSVDKFNSGTGYPSFKKPIDEKRIEFKKNVIIGENVEIRCKRCRGILGEIVRGRRDFYRINSVCVDFKKAPEVEVELPEREEKQEKKEETKVQVARSDWIRSPVVIAFVSAIAGGAIGAGATFALCRFSANATASATTTPALIEEVPAETGTEPDIEPRPAQIDASDPSFTDGATPSDSDTFPQNASDQATTTP